MCRFHHRLFRHRPWELYVLIVAIASLRGQTDDQIRRRIIDLAEKAVLWFECAGYEALLLQPKNRAASIDLSRIDRDGCCDRLCPHQTMRSMRSRCLAGEWRRQVNGRDQRDYSKAGCAKKVSSLLVPKEPCTALYTRTKRPRTRATSS